MTNILPASTQNRTSAAHRQDVYFSSSQESCHAWLYLPALSEGSRPAPIIVMAHGLGGIKRGGLEPFAERFQAAGYACLVFDYRYFGDSSGTPREWLDIARQREDWRAAVRFARTLPQVDTSRVVLWGTSFAGGHVIVTAAQDPEIAAVIAQCPFTDGLASGLAIDIGTSLKVFWCAIQDHIARAVGRQPVRVPTAGPLHSAALMTNADALVGYNAIQAASGLSDAPTLVPARIVLHIPFDMPGKYAAAIRCPVLFSICARDLIAPAKRTLRYAATAPRAEIRWYQEDHFSIYLGEAFARNIRDQLAFLSQYVPVSTNKGV